MAIASKWSEQKLPSTMEAMSLDRKSLKLLGIIAPQNKPFYWQISAIVCVITPVIFLTPVFWYFFAHFTDVSEATSAFYMICINGMATTTYSEYWRKRSTILSILQRVQNLVDNTSNDCLPLYVKAEFYAYLVVHYFKVFVFCSVFGVVSLPLCVLIVVSMIGGDVNNRRILPASLM